MKKPMNYYGFAFEKDTPLKTRKKLQNELKENGVDVSETWSLDSTLTKFILPRLKLFKKSLHGYPADLTEEGWNEILDKIIDTFELLNNDEDLYNMEQHEKVQEGLYLFAKYYIHLWD